MASNASLAPLLDFTNKTVVVTGAASGMGRATARRLHLAGATVIALDVVPTEAIDVEAVVGGQLGERSGLDLYIPCDLANEAQIEVALERLPTRIDALMNCAGVPNGGRFTAEDVMRVNWLGLRLLTESLLPRMVSGAAVVHIASTAGRAWPERIEAHQQLMAAQSFDEGLAWVADHPELVGDGYAFSKEAVQFYTHWRAVQLLPDGIRMNSVCPGITDTDIISDFRKGMGDELIDQAEALAGRIAQPEEMAPAMLFLADHASSSYINGVNLNIDNGTGAARHSEQSDPAVIWGRSGSR